MLGIPEFSIQAVTSLFSVVVYAYIMVYIIA